MSQSTIVIAINIYIYQRIIFALICHKALLLLQLIYIYIRE